MCTVIYYPGRDGILLSSNRDERYSRTTATPPAIISAGKNQCMMPLDTEAGGTWAGIKTNGEAFVLFNGGFMAHKPQPPYRLSRGLVLKAILEYESIREGWVMANLDGIEPFSIIYYYNGSLNRLVWDGAVKHWLPVDTGSPFLWSSATLYNDPANAIRIEHFNAYHQSVAGSLNVQDLYHYLMQGMAEDPWNRFVMNRQDTIGTVSISILELNEQQAHYHYWDLRADSYSVHPLQIQPNQSNSLHASQEQNITVVV